jgi:hypothetical protein
LKNQETGCARGVPDTPGEKISASGFVSCSDNPDGPAKKPLRSRELSRDKQRTALIT